MDTKEILTHPLVEKLHPDPDEHPDYVEILGYVGPSKKEGNVRIYLDTTFRSYYEVEREAILAAGSDPMPARPQRITVLAAATLEHVQITKASGPAAALHGAITSAYMAPLEQQRTSLNFTPAAPYHVTPVITLQALCVSHYVPCPIPTRITYDPTTPVFAGVAFGGAGADRK